MKELDYLEWNLLENNFIAIFHSRILAKYFRKIE
jgi:hypothetical protein